MGILHMYIQNLPYQKLLTKLPHLVMDGWMVGIL